MAKQTPEDSLVPTGAIEQRIYLIRGEKVMLDQDLAELYGVETRVLTQAVRRNLEPLPRGLHVPPVRGGA